MHDATIITTAIPTALSGLRRWWAAARITPV